MQTTTHHGGGVVIPQQQQATATATPAMAVTYQQANVVPVDQALGSKYNGASGRATGWVQLVCAIACVILGIAELVVGSSLAVVAYGIWGGVLFLLPTGILGIVSANKNACVITSYMVMSILSAMIALVVLVMGSLSAGISSSCYDYNYGYAQYYCPDGYRNARIAASSMIAIVGLVEIVTAIVAACFCCAGVCCGRAPQRSAAVVHYPNTAGTSVVVTTTPPYAQQQVVGNYGGQTVAFSTQATGPGYPVATAPPAPYPYPVQPSYPQQQHLQQPPPQLQHQQQQQQPPPPENQYQPLHQPPIANPYPPEYAAAVADGNPQAPYSQKS